MPAKILVGTSAWADETLLESGWYPPEVKTPEERLKYYASHFRLVEVDSSYYAMPSRLTAAAWAERTDPGFTFDIKAFSLLTHHPTRPKALPKDVRMMLPPEILDKRNVYQKHVPPEGLEIVWSMYRSVIRPLHQAGKLGLVLFQFPEWFPPTTEHMDYIASCKERLPDYRIAVEFRYRGWMDEEHQRQTLRFLREHDLPFVCVDMPQGFKSSIPPVAEATSDLAMVRFHGRNYDEWESKSGKPSDRFGYLYSEDELKEWVPRINSLATDAREVHVLMNNNYQNYSVTNAKQIADLLA